MTRTKDRVRDPFRSFAETAHYNPGSGDDWTRFRDGLTLLNPHFTKAEVLKRMALPSAEKKYLEAEVHLTADEFTEIEATSFRNADAHYLDECTLMRNVYRAGEIANAGSLEQSHFLFRFVMRNVMLHEQVDEWIPPAFTLRRGCGSALDRALVYLSLLRQAKTEGCLIVVPDTEPDATARRRPRRQVRCATVRPEARTRRPRQGRQKRRHALGGPRESDAFAAIRHHAGASEEARSSARVPAVRVVATNARVAEGHQSLRAAGSAHERVGAGGRFREGDAAAGQGVESAGAREDDPQFANARAMDVPAQARRRHRRRPAFRRLPASRIPQVYVMANLARFNVTNETDAARGWLLLSKMIEDLFNKYDVQPREMLLHRPARRHDAPL